MPASVTPPDASASPIEWLGEARGPAERLGGKAASLDRLARLGFRTPLGFCLTTVAFEAHLVTVARHQPLDQAFALLPAESARAQVVELVRDSDAPPSVCEALREALERLTLAGETSLAVRSSAIGEDGRTTSFAGLHETELGLRAQDVEPAVRRCWSSLWSAAAVAYRQARSLPFEGARMAVVVQALVPADASAVVFTRHPVTGRDDHMIITAVRGLGEPMVSGTATPDSWVVEKPTGAIVEFSPGDVAERLVPTDAGVTLVPDPATGPALAEAELRDLVRLAREVEHAFDAAVDIEAAHARGTWYLLQARPITTV